MTPHEPSPAEALVLWRLAASGGGAWNKDVRPVLKKIDRDRLAAAGLIEAAKRRAPEGRGAPIHLTLADAGWAWLAAHLDADLTSRSPAGTAVLALVLRSLKRYIDRTDASLADILAAPVPAPATPSAPLPLAFDRDGDALPTRIAAAYFALSDGRPNVRVRLADLRRRLADVPREPLDRALLGLDSEGRASLYRLDDPREIRPEDREAVLLTPSGEERHVVYLEGGR